MPSDPKPRSPETENIGKRHIRLTEGEAREVRRAVRASCANLDGKDCLRLDEDCESNPCPQISSHTLWCNYFIDSVLPAYPVLYAQLLGPTRDMKRCEACGELFRPSSNRAKYCPQCRKKVQKAQARDRKRRQRGRDVTASGR